MRNAMSSQLGNQHRNHQYKLHLHYKEYETKEEAMTHPPKGIKVSDWVKLCERFSSESFQIAIKVMYLPHILLAAMASSRRIVSILATGAKTSSKSMPCSFDCEVVVLLKISNKNKKNRSLNEFPPTVGTLSLARRVDMSRREGKEVSEIDQFKMAHYSKKRKGMINEKANIIWNELRAEEATLSCTPAEICLKKLGLQFLDI
ncbi:Myb domain protein 62 [Tanacetum coccineum]